CAKEAYGSDYYTLNRFDVW
nr:immunoglobulin heavy chain junction region [Macaca mulatta]MOV47786.1 immunoglobulin heavy chain junction region [Macaca mulatta]MOV47977.1 immunoglobulin heavy chain junction region [Macaca mulatta]MOV47995.1 immunoglobulin heavy chain junction region [Macaca mulatta]MOV48267.1 immunoglobulin heavy chain junction region [Macaca mulatta]